MKNEVMMKKVPCTANNHTSVAKMSGLKKALLSTAAAVILCGFGSFSAFAASPSVTASGDATALAQSLLSPACGYKISNATLIGGAGAAGSFSDAAAQIGFGDGIVLTTGAVKDSDGKTFFQEGPTGTNFSTGTGVFAPGKNYTQYQFPGNDFTDICLLQFTLTAPSAGNVSFQYCLASEEYPYYVNDFFDQFVLDVNNKNYAIIPGTVTGQNPDGTGVSIGTVNYQPGRYPEYYHGMTFVGDTANQINGLAYNGETKVFSVSAPVNKGDNTIVLAIADYSDNAYDSAVFLKTGSIRDTAAEPGNFKIYSKSEDGGTLNVLRENGSDGYAQVDVVFKDGSGNELKTSTVDYNDGQTMGSTSIPANTSTVTLQNPLGGATVDSSYGNMALADIPTNPQAEKPVVYGPADATIDAGHTATFTVDAGSPDYGTLTYQWQRNDGSGWQDISGADQASYTTGALAYSSNGMQVHCIVTNSKNGTSANATSKTVTLTVNPPPAVTPTVTGPTDQTADIGKTATFTVNATNTDGGILTYQWQHYTGGSWQDIAGADQPSYTTAALAYSDNGAQYRCVVKNTLGGSPASKTTAAATLTVNPAAVTPSINGSPADQTANIGTAVTFTVDASNTDGGDLTYQWQRNDGSGWQNIAGTDQSSYTTGTLAYADNGSQIRCVVTNSKNNTTADSTTDAAMLTVNPPAVTPSVSAGSGSDVEVNIGDTATFSVTVTSSDGGEISYQWQVSTDGGKTWSDVAGADKAAYTTHASGVDSGAVYRCRVTNTKNATSAQSYSSAFSVSVNPAVKSVENKIDALPDPAAAADQEIVDHQDDIKNTKQLYDTLTPTDRSAVDPARTTKLDRLIDRLNALLIIVRKDATTGISADGLGTSVVIPELNDQNVGKVILKLTVDKVTEPQAKPNIAIASTSLDGSGKTLLATYDLSLIKFIYGQAGDLLASGKVSNSNIVAPITIQIPVPDAYLDRTDLTMVYIDDAGNVTYLPTQIVTIDGVKYLQFQTVHFSEYAIAADKAVANPKTGNRGASALPVLLLALIGAALSTFAFKLAAREAKR